MRFVVLFWLVTRALLLAILLSAGHVAALANWDGTWYGSIVLHGYEFAPDGKQHNVAFFPLLPVIAFPLVREGVAWPIAAAILTNAAFFGALVMLFELARRAYDEAVARWCVAFACLLPASLFCSVGYPQSLFLFFSAFALYLYGSNLVVASGFATALASSASVLGIPLVVALALDGLWRRRIVSVGAAIIGCLGVGAFIVYCQIKFGDALAFVHVQAAWRHSIGFDAQAWGRIATTLVSLDGLRQNAQMLIVPAGIIAVLVEARRLGTLMTFYALLGLALLLLAGAPYSVDRNAYALAPVLIALAAVARRAPIAGYIVLAIGALILVIDAGRFAHFQWVD